MTNLHAIVEFLNVIYVEWYFPHFWSWWKGYYGMKPDFHWAGALEFDRIYDAIPEEQKNILGDLY